MTRMLVAMAILAFGASSASACNFQHSASKEGDKTVVASIEETQSMSVPQSMPSAEPLKDDTAAPAPATGD